MLCDLSAVSANFPDNPRIYMTAHRYAGGLKKLNLQSGSQRHTQFVWFFNLLIQALTQGHPFTVIQRNLPAPFSRLYEIAKI